MAPPKKAEARQTIRQPRFITMAWVQLEEGEEKLLEIINVNEIPSPDITPVKPTPVVEETKQSTPKGMNVDILAEAREKHNQDA
jgi:hypothetical protein